MPKLLRVQYPPKFEHELLIQVKELDRNTFSFTFVHNVAGTAWMTLVSAANAIIAQDNRRKRDHILKEDLR